MRTELALVAAGLALAVAAEAHPGGVERALALEPAGDHLEVLVHLEVTGSLRRRSFRALADLDRDGRLSGPERAELERLLAARALDGLVITLDGRRLALADLAAKVRVGAEGPEALMLHGRAPLPSTARRLAVETGAAGDPLTLVLVEGTRAPGDTPRGLRVSGRVEARLGVRDRVEWALGPPR